MYYWWLLDHIQAAGYRILHTGIATVPRGGTRRAWMECRKHVDEPTEDNENAHDEFMLTCRHCGEEYTPDEARTIAIFGPDEVCYTCSQCGHGTNGPSPMISKE
jgi:hypothetical protein